MSRIVGDDFCNRNNGVMGDTFSNTPNRILQSAYSSDLLIQKIASKVLNSGQWALKDVRDTCGIAAII